jgi:hypothetical protein
MTRLRRLLLPVALLGAVATLAACGGGSEGGTSVATGEPVSFEELSQAAASSADATTGRFEFSMEMSFPGANEPFGFSGAGAFDSGADRASMSFDLSSLAGLLGGLFAGMAGEGAPDLDFGDADAWKIEAVQDGTVVYMRFPAVAEELPDGKSWVRLDPTTTTTEGQSFDFDFEQFEQFTSNDPRELLDVLEAVSGEVETVGTEELRGVATTHYRATVDLANYERLVLAGEREQLRSMLGDLIDGAGVSEMPFDVWLDETGLVRKLALTFTQTQPGTTDTAEASMAFELYDYGADVEIDLPPASQVVDASALSG